MASTAQAPSAPELQGTERERIVRKIQRCLALSQSSNPNEAEMAMRQAQAMMRTYRLTEADIHAETVSHTRRSTGLARMSDWQRSLANTAATAFGCMVLQSHVPGSQYHFVFVGVMPAAELAAYAYDALLEQIKAARKTFTTQHRATRAQADAFCRGWVIAVHRQVKDFAKANTAQESNALLVITQRDEAAIKAYIDNKMGKVGQVKERKQALDPTALHMGYATGKEAKIHQGIHNTQTAQAALTFAA